MSDTQTTSPDDAQGRQSSSSVGALLRENREKSGLDVADVARVLRISQKYLEALEDGRNEDLPGTPYAIGFVRSYGEHLHLDGEEIVRLYKDEVEGIGGKTDLVFPKPIPDGGVPGTAVLGLGVLIAAVAYGVWYWQSNQDGIEMARVEPVPEHIAANEPDGAAPAPAPAPTSEIQPPEVEEVTPEPASSSMADATEPVSESETSAEDAVQNSVEEVVEKVAEDQSDTAGAVSELGAEQNTASPDVKTPSVEEAQQVVEAADVAASKAVEEVEEEAVGNAAMPTESELPEKMIDVPEVERAAETDEVAAAPDSAMTNTNSNTNDADALDSRVRLRAKIDNWILVRDGQTDRLLFSRVLAKGDYYDVPNRPDLLLMTGNAGALDVLVDGELAPPLGGMGEVRRDVALDPEKLKSGLDASN